MITAVQPWSGAYGAEAIDGTWSAGPVVWASAHTTQFTVPLQWSYLAINSSASRGGAGLLPGGGSYVTLKDFSTGHFTVVIEKMTRNFSSCVRPDPGSWATVPEQATFTLAGGLAKGVASLRVWRTHWSFGAPGDATEEFVEQAPVPVGADGTFSLALSPDSIYTVTTLPAGWGAKGAPPARPPSPAPATLFPAWHADDFEGCAPPSEAPYFSDQSGAFECVPAGGGRGGVALRSATPAMPIGWGGDVRPHTLIGHRDTVNASLTVDFMLEGANATALVGLRVAKLISSHGLLVAVGGSAWALWGDIGLKGKPAAGGALPAPIAPGTWHTLRADVNGSALRLWVDGAPLTPSPLPAGAVAGHVLLGTGGFGQFVQFDNFSLASVFAACPAADVAQPPPGQPLQVVQCASEVGLRAGSGFSFSAPTGGVGALALRAATAQPLCASTAPGATPSDPWPVTLAPCAPGAAAQQWQWIFDAVCPQNKRGSKIVNPTSGRCLDMGPAFYTGALGDFPNEGASGVMGAPMVATECKNGQSSGQNFFFDSNSGELMNQGSVTCVGVCQ